MPNATAAKNTASRKTIERFGTEVRLVSPSPATTAAATASVAHRNASGSGSGPTPGRRLGAVRAPVLGAGHEMDADALGAPDQLVRKRPAQ